MTAPEVRTIPDGLNRGGEWVLAGDRKLGRIFPVVVAEPDGEWFGKVPFKDAKRCDDKEAA
ncbi:MAG: hypothetical protein ABW022_07320 [Actinoplanes sp.]